MFCLNCGNQLNEGSVLCEKCGNSTLNADQQKPAQSIVTFPIKQTPILKQRERGFIIATGVLYMIMSIITFLVIISTKETLGRMFPSEFQDIFNIIIVGSIVGSCVNIFLGVMVLKYKRWALLTLRIFEIIGIVFLFFIFDPDDPTAFSYFLSLCFDIILLCFINISAKALSTDVQSCRAIARNAK